MRILAIHATRMEYRATQRTRMAEPDPVREDAMEEGVVLFCCVEKLDERNPGYVAEHAAQDVMDRLGKLKVARVMIFPYAHLANTLARPEVALAVLAGLADQLRARGIEVRRAPFGWYKEFTIHSKGHPLADLSMTICPYEGVECDFQCPYCHNPLREGDIAAALTGRQH
ncbi:MAG TPA: threonyl-tRNA synthetase editing domain-containing protein [Methanomicrobiales archaeon]|nr:threonyl-tRNA synthetase editing domain-containing protein [Methanomicrobiales archaeon]